MLFRVHEKGQGFLHQDGLRVPRAPNGARLSYQLDLPVRTNHPSRLGEQGPSNASTIRRGLAGERGVRATRTGFGRLRQAFSHWWRSLQGLPSVAESAAVEAFVSRVCSFRVPRLTEHFVQKVTKLALYHASLAFSFHRTLTLTLALGPTGVRSSCA